jgi:hypothetical protein
MEIIIAGGRDFEDYSLLKVILDKLLSKTDYEDITIFSGKARGADSLGERYANQHGIKVKEFKADWKGLGKKAGILRNIQMGDEASHAVILWDGLSRGSRQMLDYATKKGLVVRAYNYKGERY